MTRLFFKTLQLAIVQSCLGAIYDSFTQLPQDTFDFVIIGGGAGGNAVANRLTEIPSFSVLLLEAEPSPEGLVNYTVPFFDIYLRQPDPLDWNYTVSSAGLNNRVLTFPRGRLLGGSTSINGLGYVRGSSDDFDRYARATGDPGWGYKLVQNERWIAPTDNHPQIGELNPIFHGFHGINSVSLAGFPSPPDIDNRVAGVIQELSDEFPYNEDINSGAANGVSWVQSNIKHGTRSKFISRPNLHVLLNAQATRLIQSSSDPIAFQSVEFASGRNDPRQRVAASKELTSRSRSPSSTMQTQPKPLTKLPRNATFRDELLHEWIRTDGGGPLGISYTSHNVLQGFRRTPQYSRITQIRLLDHGPVIFKAQCRLILSLSMRANHSLLARMAIYRPTVTGNFLSMPATLLTPTSRGSIRLNTTDPFTQPLIDVASLTTDFDIFGLREAVKMTHRFLAATAWQGYILQPASFSNLPFGATDEEIETYIRANAAPNGHVIGTASMSPKGASYGVVDPDLIVKGVSGLRVVDASILPYLPAGFTMTSTYVVAERASDMIKAKWM
ncbi:aryl-alcohol oxidase [Mycena alexandri]|uniref:Aryl-alcohol oxidase n=1 Tax=Mycena alexandri TaxID=1745969 RepID=A0AAD6RXG9_9AGAR|nr:aryl-alcohol oxidase [Mycena alexandri]